jgi:hypothetical protein
MVWYDSVPEGTSGSQAKSTAATQVLLDGVKVVATEGAPNAIVAEKVLLGASGNLPLLVRSSRAEGDSSPYWTLRLMWRSPGMQWNAFVPYSTTLDERQRIAAPVKVSANEE